MANLFMITYVHMCIYTHTDKHMPTLIHSHLHTQNHTHLTQHIHPYPHIQDYCCLLHGQVIIIIIVTNNLVWTPTLHYWHFVDFFHYIHTHTNTLQYLHVLISYLHVYDQTILNTL